MHFEDNSAENFLWGWENIKNKESGVSAFEKIACNTLQIDQSIYLNPSVLSSLSEMVVSNLFNDATHSADVLTQRVATRIKLGELAGRDEFVKVLAASHAKEFAEAVIDYVCNQENPALLDQLEAKIKEYRLRRFSDVIGEV